MPVIYSTITGAKGFFPCSRPYRTALIRAIQNRDYPTAAELFQQAHRLIWRLSRDARTYQHILYPDLTISVEEFRRIAALPGDQIAEALLLQQCGNARGARRSTGLVGPQVAQNRRGALLMQRVQNDSYAAAGRAGFPVQSRVTYAPSPFEQKQDGSGVWRPVNQDHQPGLSGGPCATSADCRGVASECTGQVCTIPVNQRQCPPFQYPIEIEPGVIIDNPSAQRTTKVNKYSPTFNTWYDTCLPGPNYTVQRWVLDPRLRRYIGLSFDVIQIPPDEWARTSRLPGTEVLSDPATNAPYFLRRDVSGLLKRYYRLNSAYSPELPRPPPPLPLPGLPLRVPAPLPLPLPAPAPLPLPFPAPPGPLASPAIPLPFPAPAPAPAPRAPLSQAEEIARLLTELVGPIPSPEDEPAPPNPEDAFRSLLQ